MNKSDKWGPVRQRPLTQEPWGWYLIPFKDISIFIRFNLPFVRLLQMQLTPSERKMLQNKSYPELLKWKISSLNEKENNILILILILLTTLSIALVIMIQ